jgi:hypothetical protein
MYRVLLALLLPAIALVAAGGMYLLVANSGGDAGTPVSRDEGSPGPEVTPDRPRLESAGNVCQGYLSRPDPSAERVFDPEYVTRVEVNGIYIVANANVSDEAVKAAIKTVERVFANNDLEEVLVQEGAYVIIADSSQGVLDLPEFRCLDSERSQDFFTHVCGVADRADYPVATVNERDLTGDRRGPCRGLNILYHELGHLVQGWTLEPADYFEIRLMYQNALNEGKYEGDYAATNFNEYFAEGTQAYFLHVEPGGARDREWLREYDPALFELLDRIYGD